MPIVPAPPFQYALRGAAVSDDPITAQAHEQRDRDLEDFLARMSSRVDTTGATPAGDYTPYTPTWTNTSGTPIIPGAAAQGGFNTGRYKMLSDRTVHCVIDSVFANGGGENGQTGGYVWGLPPGLPALCLRTGQIAGGGYYYDASTNLVYGTMVRIDVGAPTRVYQYLVSPTGASVASLGATHPVQVGGGDEYNFSFTYEADL